MCPLLCLEYERDIFLTQFNEENGKQTIGFAVLGGVFAESIDLLGDRLTGVVIVGVGLPGLCLERELIRDYYDRLNESGFAFAYQFPGMVKVMQAGGRVIRSEQDRGSVLLIGTRFRKPPYRTLLPEDWKPVVIGNLAMIEEMLQDFWNKKVTTP